MNKLFLTIMLSVSMFLNAETLEVPVFKYFLTSEQVQKEILDKQAELQTLKIPRADFSYEPALLFLSGHFHKLETLHIGVNAPGNSIPQFSFETFAPNLKHLVLSDFFFMGYSAEHKSLEGRLFFITSFKNLETLSLIRSNNWDEVTKASLDRLGLSLPSLKELGLHLDIVHPDFSLFQALENLDLSYASINGALDLSNLSNLKRLNISHIRKDYVTWTFDFRSLTPLNALESLNLSGRDFTQENIEQTLYTILPSLKELVFNESKIKGAHFSTFAPNLKRLSLVNSNITGGDIAQIAQLGELEFLDISSTSIAGPSIKKLGMLSSLKELSLANTNMSKTDFAAVPSSLEVLNLAGSTLSIASFDSLYTLTHIKKLDVRNIQNSNITNSMVQHLQEALPNCEVVH